MSNYQWDDAPNRQQAIETTIPTLSGLMLGFLGALFVAAAITDVAVMKNPVEVRPLPWSAAGQFALPLPRSFWVCATSFAAGLCFYFSIRSCVWSQMQVYKPGAGDNPDVP